jgi:CheY-like chemotaxis protein
MSTQMQSTSAGTSSEAVEERVLLVAEPHAAWIDTVEGLEPEGVQLEVVPPAELTRALAIAERSASVALVDISEDPSRGLFAISAFRWQAPRVPVVAIANNPSVDLVRRIRLAGVFYLALEPVTAEEMRTVLHDAFECLHTGRSGPSAAKATPRVLIIDDDTDFATSTGALLEAQGYVVSRARNGKEGLAKVSAEAPDLVVLDILMEHDWAGYEVNQAIKFGGGFEAVRQIPILMVSSVEIDPASRFAMASEAGMINPDAYLTKPLDIPRFLETVRALLGQPPGPEGRR